MIELLLEAERALSFGRVERAEQLYQQVAKSDPRNSIAVVGLARVALERADDLGAYLLARRALGIDPENEAAQRLATRLEEVMRTRGEDVPATADVPGWPSRPSVVPPSLAPKAPTEAAPETATPTDAGSGAGPASAPEPHEPPAPTEALPGVPPLTPTGATETPAAGAPASTPKIAPESKPSPKRRSVLDRIRRR